MLLKVVSPYILYTPQFPSIPLDAPNTPLYIPPHHRAQLHPSTSPVCDPPTPLPLNLSRFWLVNTLTKANQIICIHQPNLHKILIFSLYAARIDELADS